MHLPAVPTERFLGIRPGAWKAVDTSKCAARRFATLVGGARLDPETRSGSQIRSAHSFKPRTTVGHGPAPPSATIGKETVTCGWCGAVFKGPWAQLRYHQACAPDAEVTDEIRISEAPRKKIKVRHRDNQG